MTLRNLIVLFLLLLIASNCVKKEPIPQKEEAKEKVDKSKSESEEQVLKSEKNSLKENRKKSAAMKPINFDEAAILVPNIEGELVNDWVSEKAISNSSKKINLVFMDGSTDKPEQETQIYFFTFKGYFGFLAKCYDNDINHLVYSHTVRDDAIWQDDNLELNLDIDPDNTDDDIRVSVNPLGTFADAKGKLKEKWNAEIKTKSLIKDKMWIVQVLIPLKSIGNATQLKNLKGNLSRTRYGHKNSSTEETAWRKTFSLRSNIPQFYGEIAINESALNYEIVNANLTELPIDTETESKLLHFLKKEIGNQVVICNPTNEDFTIDGKLNEMSWKYQRSNFLQTQDHRDNLNMQDTYFKVSYRENNLYIGITCTDSQMSELSEKVKENEKDFGEDDLIELFLNPNRFCSNDYLHLLINPANAKIIQINKTKLKPNEVNPYAELFQNIQTATEKSEDKWTIEIAIPLNKFKLENTLPSEWGFNLTRYRPQKSGLPCQTTSWSDLLSLDFHQCGKFGLLWLNGKNKIPTERAEKILSFNAKSSNDRLEQNSHLNFKNKSFDFLSKIFKSEDVHQMTSKVFDNLRDLQVNARNENWNKLFQGQGFLIEQQELRKNFIKNIGGFPEKTPLNVKMNKIHSGMAYDVYNVLYESMPKHYVTGNLFLPTNLGDKKVPVIIRIIGHSTPGKNSKNILTFNDHLARQGYAVFAIDSLGQGERIFVNQGNGSRTPTSNHYAMGAPCVLNGQNIARYFVWDIIRAVDLVSAEPNIDSQKIILTGESGGGTVTSYVAALEPRIAGAASCSAMGSDVNSTGGHDSEQQLANCFSQGFDSMSRAAMIAPRPYAILGEYGTEDHLKSNYEMVDQARMAFKFFGKENNLEYYPTKEPHGYGAGHRKIFYKWISKYFPTDIPFSMDEKPLLFKDTDALYVTKTWRVYYSRELKDRITVQDMNLNYFEKSQKAFSQFYKPNNNELIRKTLMIALNINIKEVQAQNIINHKKEVIANDLSLEQSYIKLSDDLSLPFLLVYKGQKMSNQLIIWLNQRGKDITLKSRFATIDQLTQRGYTICLPDLRGLGELSQDDSINHFSNDTDLNFYSIRVGQSYLGRMVLDAWIIQKSLKQAYPNAEFSVIGDSSSKTNPSLIRVDRLLIDDGLEDLQMAESVGPICALFLTILELDCKKAFVNGSLSSYGNILEDFYFYHPFNIFVNGFLTQIDIPETCLALSQKQVTLANMVNGKNQLISEVLSEQNKYLKIKETLKKFDPKNTFLQFTEGDVNSLILREFK